MGQIRQYLLSVIAAAAICGCITALFGNKGTFGTIIKLLTGLFLAITMISPWTRIKIADYTLFLDDITASAKSASQQGERMAEAETQSIIKAQAEAYILDKATSLGLDISVEVSLDETSMVPCAITINGPAGPYAKSRLQQYIVKDLGILEENQKWT